MIDGSVVTLSDGTTVSIGGKGNIWQTLKLNLTASQYNELREIADNPLAHKEKIQLGASGMFLGLTFWTYYNSADSVRTNGAYGTEAKECCKNCPLEYFEKRLRENYTAEESQQDIKNAIVWLSRWTF